MNTSELKSNGYELVKYAADLPECEACGEAYCPDCDLHFFECPCLGCMECETVVDYQEDENGELWGKRKAEIDV